MRQALMRCLTFALSALVCAGLMSVAALEPAPPAALPAIVMVCIGGPTFASLDLLSSIAVLRAGRYRHRRALRELRSHLAELPETHHPLGL
jgi:hypothetical protein